VTDPRPNNEPRPRVVPEQAPSRLGGPVLTVAAFVLAIIWIGLFVMQLMSGGGGDWFETWWPLVSAVAFTALGIDRLRRARRPRSSPRALER
jgi:hypothetical protein